MYNKWCTIKYLCSIYTCGHIDNSYIWLFMLRYDSVYSGSKHHQYHLISSDLTTSIGSWGTM